jgi:hypothetical protein
MGKVLVSAAAGALAALAVMAAFYFGVRLSPEILMMLAAALTIGAAVSVLTRVVLDAPADKPSREKFLAKRIRDVKGLIDFFPHSNGAVRLSIRSDSAAEDLDIVKNAQAYRDKDIVVTIKEGPKTFNPVTLRKIFQALREQANFLHLILRNKQDEYVGYIPAHVVKKEFTGDNAEARITEYVVNVLDDTTGEDKGPDGERLYANSANLRKIGGLANTDTISDEDSLSRALDRMQGGFLRLVVLKGGYHRRPVGLLHSERLVSATKAE